MNNNLMQKVGVWLIVGLVLFTVFKQFDKPRAQENITYSQFMEDAKNGKVKRVDVQGRNIQVVPMDGQKYSVVSPGDIWMVGDLMKYGVFFRESSDHVPYLPRELLSRLPSASCPLLNESSPEASVLKLRIRTPERIEP